MNTALLETPAALQAVFQGVEVHRGTTGMFTTCMHLMHRIRQIEPLPTIHQLAPHLRTFCEYHELDYDAYQEQFEMILDEGLEMHAPVYDAVEKFETDPYRDKLPEDMVHTDDREKSATIFKHIGESSESGTFFMSCRKLGDILGKSHEHGRRVLKTLCRYNVLELVQKGVAKPGSNASEYRYIPEGQRAALTHKTNNSHTNHTTKADPILTTDPELESIDQGLCRGTDWDPELHDDLETIQDDEHDPAMDTILEHAESSKGLVGKNAALFEEQPHPTSPLGTPDELIAMAVERKPGGVQGVLPKQESLPEPTATATATAALEEKIRATAPDPEGVPKSLDQALISLGQTFKAMETKQQTAPRIDEPTANCYRCKKPTTYQTPEGSEFDPERDAVVCKSCMDQSGETQSAKGVLPSERCRAELKENASKDKSLDDVKRGAAAILGKFLGENEAPDVKRIYDMILKYKSTAVIKATCKIINDPKKGSMGTTIGVLAWRLKEADLAVAV